MISFMHSNFPETKSELLDLTDHKTVFELGFEDGELLGANGAKVIADLKERARDAEYTHMYYRDPVRPGIIWFVELDPNEMQLPTRAKLEESRKVTERVFPRFISNLRFTDDDVIMQAIPPIRMGVSGLDLAIALEYIIFLYPEMVRAWAALIFCYKEILNLKHSADFVYQECASSCEHAQIVAFMMKESSDVVT